MVPLLEFFEDGGHLCLVMPRYNGSVFDAIQKAKGPLDEPTALKIALDLFTGLQGLHARRIVHRVGFCHELLLFVQLHTRTRIFLSEFVFAY